MMSCASLVYYFIGNLNINKAVIDYSFLPIYRIENLHIILKGKIIYKKPRDCIQIYVTRVCVLVHFLVLYLLFFYISTG